jgi:hypothetical protein
MGRRTNEDEEHAVDQSPNNVYMHRHDVRLRNLSQAEDDDQFQTVHYVDRYEIPRSLQVPPSQRMSQEGQMHLLVGILGKLSKHPYVYRPQGSDQAPAKEQEPKPHPRQYPLQVNPIWSFGRGEILDPSQNMAKVLWGRKYGGKHGLDAGRRNTPPPPSQEVLRMVRRLSIQGNTAIVGPRHRASVSHGDGVKEGRVSKGRLSAKRMTDMQRH